MKRTTFCLACLVVLVGASLTLVVVGSPQQSPAGQAREILDAAGVQGGLIVHLGCGDGRLTAALRRGPAYVVHGLDADASDIQDARRFIRSSGSYGPVSIERWDAPRLPYGDNLVNLVVVEEPGEVRMAEVMRVLAPQGVACAKRSGGWEKHVKPQPADTDDWTHFLHDASGNAVAHDQVAGPPKHMQWTAEPPHTRSHEHTPSINALVSTRGRIFYIADQASVAWLQEPPQWHLVARDAYNGLPLWKRSFTGWFPYMINWGVAPAQLQRRLVAARDHLYVTLGFHAPLSVVDAATGDVLKVYEDTAGTEEIVHHSGVLLLAIRAVTNERAAELEELARLSAKARSALHKRESAQTLVDRFRAIEGKAGKTIAALDTDTGRVLWRKTGADASGLRQRSLSAAGDRAFYQNGNRAMCVDLRTGRELWSSPVGGLRMVSDGLAFCVSGRTVTALSARTGKTRWTQTALLTEIRDAFVAGGSLWLGGFKPIEGKRSPAWGPYFVTQRDLATGKVLRHIEPENPGHHHRCYQNKATDRYILAGRRGIEFFDLESGDVLEHSWVRGVCKYGVMPCNGLVYSPPNACACYVGTKVTGFCALAAQQEATVAETGLTVTRADSPASDGESPQTSEEAWPTYRHDAQRSGSTRASVSAALRPKWRVHTDGALTSPTVAGGKVFVTARDRHEVLALGCDSGAEAWTFTAGGRVDSPPTIHGGQVLFGCRDGNVYCLRASDGKMLWRFQAAGAARRIVASGQLESASPIHGSVLIRDDVACFTAGRSSYLDGGIGLYRLDPKTGRQLSRTQVYSPDPQTGKQPPQFAPYAMPGVRSDILSADGEHIYLRNMVFDGRGREQAEGNAHLFTLTDFLDDSWPHRSYWIFGTRCSIACGCSGQEKGLIYGRLLAFDDSAIYGYGRARLHWSNQFQDGAYRLFAAGRNERTLRWEKPVRIQVRAMLLADKVLFVAGPSSETSNASGGSDRAESAMLLAVSATDGATLAQYRLEAPPVFDGMAAIENRLYVTLENGNIVCMEGEPL